MRMNGKLGTSSCHGASMERSGMLFKCSATFLLSRWAWESTQFTQEKNSQEVEAAHICDYVCRESSVLEQEFNFPMEENNTQRQCSLSSAGAREASRLVALIKAGSRGLSQDRKFRSGSRLPVIGYQRCGQTYTSTMAASEKSLGRALYFRRSACTKDVIRHTEKWRPRGRR